MRSQIAGKVQATILFTALIAVFCPAAFTQQDRSEEGGQRKYTLASVCGDYSVVATYGANVARALGSQSSDGRGNFTGSATTNQPGPGNTRSLTSFAIGGTYTVNPDGTGKMFVTVTLPGGSTAQVTEDFVITKAKIIDGMMLATEIEDAQEVPSAVIDDSSLVIHRYTLRTSSKSCTANR